MDININSDNICSTNINSLIGDIKNLSCDTINAKVSNTSYIFTDNIDVINLNCINFAVENQVKTEQLNANNVTINGIVKINKSGNCQLKVYNSVGCLMLQPSTFVDSFDLNISHLSKGIYYLEIRDSNFPEIVRLFKD